jgi:hypothetical protein
LKGDEPIGSGLCNSPAGNEGGINDPRRSPQARYGDASVGDCASQIVVNDASS